MTNDAHHNGEPGGRPTDEAALSARLRRLGERLEHKQPSRSSESTRGARSSADASALARGLRLSSELIGGVLVGAFIGWLLDRWLGISPWGLMLFVMIGFAAGVLNVIRSAGVASGGEPNEDKR